jgi:hypothetical protein
MPPPRVNISIKRLIAIAVVLWVVIAIPFPEEGGGILAAVLIFGTIIALVLLSILAIRWAWRHWRKA